MTSQDPSRAIRSHTKTNKSKITTAATIEINGTNTGNICTGCSGRKNLNNAIVIAGIG